MDVQIVTLQPRRLVALRHVGSYRKIGDAFEHLRALAAKCERITTEPEFLGLSYDDPGAMEARELRFDACMTIGEEMTVGPRSMSPLRRLEHHGGRHAVYRHVGPYQLLEHVFDRLFDAVVFSGTYELRDAPCVEVYGNDPNMVKPEELITDVYIPIV